MSRVKITKKTEEVEDSGRSVITLGHVDIDITKEMVEIRELLYEQYYKHWDLKSCECNTCEGYRKLLKIIGFD